VSVRRLSLSDYDYELPPELIAQEPLSNREASRLLHVYPDGGLQHFSFRDLPALLGSGDLLVINDTKVFPARLYGRRDSGGSLELLLIEELDANRYRVLAKPAGKLGRGAHMSFGDGRLHAEVEGEEDGGRRIVRFELGRNRDDSLAEVLDALGTTPLPPYIKRPRREGGPDKDEIAMRNRYQTVYAAARGSVAAPTAGLHFTNALLEQLRRNGVMVASLTLHVGYATFEPIHHEAIDQHAMGAERYFVPRSTVDAIRETRGRGGKVVAVGTTSVRALESAALAEFADGWQTSRLFISPGHEFRVVDGLLTNLHLPKSSLLILVSSLGGYDIVRRAYAEAVRERYRFYSFGDAMLIHPARYGASASSTGSGNPCTSGTAGP
jgi:S-adenosylmethionine:tRNA ribosyltransferase-isomerase